MADDPVKQHLVSRVLLARWAVDGVITAVDLTRGKGRYRSPRAEGFKRWFVKGGRSASMEKLWNSVEDRFRLALTVVDDGTLFDHPDHVATIKDIVALHLIRAQHSKVMWDNALKANIQSGHAANILQMVGDPDFLAGHFHERTGLLPAGIEALHAERERILEELDRRIGPGGAAFADSLEEEFAKVRQHLEPRGLEIGMASTT